MTIIPGDTYRISISGADSSILVDSWNSVITANVRAGDDSTLVDIYQKKFFGTVDGKLDGLIVNSVGDVVLNPGTEHEAALFLGDVTGNVTGNATGDHSGTFTGDVFSDDGDLFYNGITKEVRADNIITETFQVTNFAISRIDADSVYADSFTGHVIGDVVGETTGTHYGNVIGDLTGNVIGNVTGDLTGNVIGNVTGNVTGNIHSSNAVISVIDANEADIETINNSMLNSSSGNFDYVNATRIIGDLEGNIYSGETSIVTFEDANNIGIGSHSNTMSLGHTDCTGTINLNYNLLNNFIGLPTSDGHAPNKFFAFRGTKSNPQNLNPGDHMNLHSVSGYINGSYKHTGIFGFFINPDKSHSSSDTYSNCGLLFAASGANHAPDITGKKRVIIDDQGVLHAGVLQTSTYTSTERSNISASAGMIIFNTSTNKFQGYTGSSWVDLH